MLVTKEETKKRKISWFRPKSNTKIQLDSNKKSDSRQELSLTKEGTGKELEALDINSSDKDGGQNSHDLFSKDKQDKVVVDLINSIENIIKDRQLILYENKGLNDQLYSANETINRLKEDQVKKDQLLQEKNKEIRELENSLTNKQMGYDQLLEDYREYQNTSTIEYEKILNQLEAEINKYKKLNEESMSIQHQNMLKINNLEEKIRNLEVENQQYIDQYESIAKEKAQLMETINDFTQRMSFSFNPQTNTSNSSNSE